MKKLSQTQMHKTIFLKFVQTIRGVLKVEGVCTKKIV